MQIRSLFPFGVVLSLLVAPLGAQCELQFLQGANSLPKDFFGKSAAMEGERLIVGAFAATTARPGCAHVFELQNGSWNQVAKLRPSDGGSADQFGNSVGISGDWAIVGSEFNDNQFGNNAGAAYLYQRIAGRWREMQKIQPSDARQSQHFGEYVAIEGDVAVVGCRFDSDAGNNAGAAYVFELQGGLWVETAKLIGSAAGKNDLSGDTVAIDGGRIVMSSYRSDASGSNSGSAYLFEKIAGTWTEVARLAATDKAGELSRGVAIDGDRVVLGARLDSTQGPAAGAGYVFEKWNGVWIQTAKLLPKTARDYDWVGEAVAVQGDRIVLSGHHHDLIGVDSGVAYVFELQNGVWVETKTLQSSLASPHDEFSFALAMSGQNLVATSPFESGNVGAAFAFTFQEDLCSCGGENLGLANAFGEGLGGANIGLLTAESMPEPEALMVMRVSGIPGGTNGVLYLAQQRISRLAYGGTLLVPAASAPVRIPFVLKGGEALPSWLVPSSLCGMTFYAQAVASDLTQPFRRAYTNGLELAIGF